MSILFSISDQHRAFHNSPLTKSGFVDSVRGSGAGRGCGMAMGREGDRQDDLIVTWAEMPRSPGHAFYDRLQEVLMAGGFDRFVETACQAYYAPKMGAPSLPPGRYFRMHMVGYFEGIASERVELTPLNRTRDELGKDVLPG